MVQFDEAVKIATDWDHVKPPWAGEHPEIPQNVGQITQKCIDTFLLSKGDRGNINGIGWWQYANGYTAIALHDLWSNSNKNYDYLADALRKCDRNKAGFINEFNDDTLWWGLCCVHVYKLGGDSWFLEKAKNVWNHMQNGRRGQSSVCGRHQIQCCEMDMEGGCYWKTELASGYLNAISTGLYAELSARLALLEHDGESQSQQRHPHLSKLQEVLGGHHSTKTSQPDYLEAARCSLGWLLRCVYRPRDAVVMDGISTGTKKLTNWTFTYNTGTALGVCALLYEATREEAYMTLACHMAHRAMRNRGWCEENGVLTDLGAWGRAPSEPAKNGDGVGFKAVLVRHLGTLYEVIRKTGAGSGRETAELIRTFVGINFESQEKRNTNGRGQYGPWWNGPYVDATSHSQLPVLDVMAAIRLVERS